MKSIFSLYKLKMMTVIRSAVLVIPTVSVVVFLGVMYSILPQQISASFLSSGLLLFVICVYVSMCIQMKEQDVHEELFLMHSRPEAGYYPVREMVVCSIMLFYAVLLIVYPVIRSSLNENWFTRPLTSSDVFYGTILILGSGICGITLGDFFHHRIIPRRRNAIIFVVLVAVLAVCKEPIIEKLPGMKFLHFLLPPITDGFIMVGNEDFFDPKETMLILLHSVIYALALVFIKIWLLRRRKF